MESGRLAAVLDELVGIWDGSIVRGEATIKPKWTKTHPQAALVLALAVHAHEVARELRPAMPGRLTVVHMPLVRAVLETTIRLVWIDKFEDASAAMMHEENRQRQLLKGKLQSVESLAKYAEDVWLDDQAWPTESAAAARQFEKVTEALDAPDIYAIYRLLSGFSHPSVLLADPYLETSEDAAFTLIGRVRILPSTEAMSATVACCLVWTQRTVTYYNGDRVWRNDLRKIGRDLGLRVP